MKKIRDSIFETNSSSMHSFCFSSSTVCYTVDELKKLLISDDGLIHLFFDEYGWNGPDIKDVKGKMSYCVFQLIITHTGFHTFGVSDDVCEIINNLGLENVINIFGFNDFKKSLLNLCEKLGLFTDESEYSILDKFKFKFDKYSGIDHQSVGDFDIDSMVDVISRKDGFIEISNDN